jgi:hypothetical protein
MKQQTPIKAGTLTGVETIAAEAAMSLATSLSGKSAVISRRNHSDVPLVPVSMPEVR